MGDLFNDDPVQTNTYTPGFEACWEAFPAGRKKEKKACFKIWQEKRLERLWEDIRDDIRWRSEFDKDWTRGYVPLTKTYFNGDRWEDGRAKVKPKRYMPKRPEEPEGPTQECRFRRKLNQIALFGYVLPATMAKRSIPEGHIIAGLIAQLADELKALYEKHQPDQSQSLPASVAGPFKAYMHEELRGIFGNPEHWECKL